jgi:tRNA threonylcarbamoyladenosine biosynthesis protein TsaB
MLLLAFDTAGPDCAVALARGGGGEIMSVLARHSRRIGRGHADLLMPMIGEALDEAGLTYPDLDRIAVTTGPGSFTGVRVGIAAARGLALALDRPAIGVGTLEALALPLFRQGGSGTAVAVLDARRGEIFARAEDRQTGALVLKLRTGTPEDIAVALDGAAGPLRLTGSGAPLLARALETSRTDLEIVSTAESPDIADVAFLGISGEPGHLPVPLYARGADARPQAHRAVARAS